MKNCIGQPILLQNTFSIEIYPLPLFSSLLQNGGLKGSTGEYGSNFDDDIFLKNCALSDAVFHADSEYRSLNGKKLKVCRKIIEIYPPRFSLLPM